MKWRRLESGRIRNFQPRLGRAEEGLFIDGCRDICQGSMRSVASMSDWIPCDVLRSSLRSGGVSADFATVLGCILASSTLSLNIAPV